ncbi:MAG: hypothetical protein KVP17_004887 [Porospora cf. gigantea B]|uniref:uncharacterized protein n=1 Tax=Porospora cf. gigantea B TaxID=2853592 RepID=UPI0035719DE9|nr:MAG: hypothetical protein KVP17_004887 [Porospora cf. gigantea B]
MRFLTVAVLFVAVRAEDTYVGAKPDDGVQDAVQPSDTDEGLKGLLQSFLPNNVLRDLPDMDTLLNNPTVRGLLGSLGEVGNLEELLSGVNLRLIQSLLEDPAAAAALIKSFGWRSKAFSIMQSVKSALEPSSEGGPDYLQQLLASVAAQPEVARMLADPRIADAARLLGDQTKVIPQTTASPTETDEDDTEVEDKCETPLLKH